MRFDVKDTGKDWLISGRKKGDYEATVGLGVYPYSFDDANRRS